MRRVSSIEQPALQQMLAKAPAVMRTEAILLYRPYVFLSAIALVLPKLIAVIVLP